MKIVATVRGSEQTLEKIDMEERHYLYCSTGVIRLIKSRRMRWAGYVARMVANRISYRVLM
jgi:hypothetical protein